MEERIRFCDAHHHFLDTTANYYPRLCDRPLGRFRYGGYEGYPPPRYLAEDFLRDAARQNLVTC